MSHAGAFLVEPLDGVDLAPRQEAAVATILRTNEAWLETLRFEFERARAASLGAIGPDFERVSTGRRFQHLGEIAALFWGNQARVLNEVASLLDPEQRQILKTNLAASIDGTPEYGAAVRELIFAA